MLVNARKLIFSLILLLSWNAIQSQEAWTLQQCIDSSQVYNKSLQINRNTISSSQEREKEAKSNLIPKFSLNADYKYFIELPHQLMPMSALNPQVPEGQFREVQFGVPHNINANLQLVMPLYNPQLYGGIQNTKIATELTHLQYRRTEEEVLFDVTTLYYNAQILKHQLTFIEHNLINANKLLRNLQLLHEQLLVRGTDVNKVKLQTDQLSTQKNIVSDKYIQVLNALKLNMGISLNRSIDVETEINYQAQSEYTTNASIEIQMIQVQNKLLHRELKTLNQSRYLPSLNLIASYGTTGFGYDKSPNKFLDFYPIGFTGIQFSYPIFNGTSALRKINQKKWEIENNVLQSQLINDKNKMEIENATRQQATALQAITNTENQINQAQTIYEQTLLQQNQGTANLTDVLLADNALREAQQSYLSAIIDYLKANLEMQKLMGNLGEGTIKNGSIKN